MRSWLQDSARAAQGGSAGGSGAIAKMWLCSRAVPRVASEQRTCIDDVLGSLVKPRELLCDSKEKHTHERFQKNMPRKYTHYGLLGQEVETPCIRVREGDMG